MKKNMIFPAILLFLFAGCSEKDNGIDYNNEEIRIVSKFGSVTRGDGPIDSGFLSDLNVGFARLDDEETNYSEKLQLDGTVNGTTKVLSFSDTQYYLSANKKTRLIGWYPGIEATGGAFSEDDGSGKVTFPVIDGSTDIMVTEMVEGSQESKFDPIVFDHILSQVTVQAYAEDATDAAATWGKIQAVKILGKGQSIELTLPTAKEDKPTVNPKGTAALPLSGFSPVTLTESATALGTTPTMFAPGDHTSNKLKIEITTEKKETVIAEVLNNFVKGTSYIITLKFNKSGASSASVPITSDVSVTNWIPGLDPEESAIEVPTDADITVPAYASQTIEVTLIDDEEATGSADEPEKVQVQLDNAGKGSLWIGDKVIKSIEKISGGTPILIGRKKAGESKITVELNVDGSHKVQWRTKEGDNTTALIGTAAELLLKFTGAPSTITTYIFEADIDLMSQTWVPVSSFTKIIDGNGHKIHNLKITEDFTTGSNSGIFRSVSGTIQNLHIASGEILATNVGDSKYVAVFAGYLNGGEIIGCSNRAKVKSEKNAGGICGWFSTGNIINCTNYGDVTVTDTKAAGICCYLNSTGKIQECLNVATITGNTNVGGICSEIHQTNAEITACANKGKVIATSSGAGGICHLLYYGTIKACYNTGTIQASKDDETHYACGGIVGMMHNHNSNTILISACYNIGTISPKEIGELFPENEIGAIVGYNDDATKNITTNCFYSTCAYGAGTEGTKNLPSSFPSPTTVRTPAKVFSSTAWPSSTNETNWGIGNGSTDGNYWKSLGVWNSGAPIYPQLYWEED
ncbi:hypothetical protein EZS27_003790 [termite gut metagenome]|uniref:GLUG domain-containing protein n=1 Tax=termite gut metagenome TaxID=433724 RepID=A0A5J4SSJ7_9ZZZZ